MDRGTKIYGFFLAIFTLALGITFFYESPKTSELNNRLESISLIDEFPYQFKVLRINNGTAIMSSPRSTDVPVSRILGILFPEVKGKSTQSPEFQKAQKALAKVQILARETVISDAEIKTVSWELDHSWLLKNGISL
ncbi:MAG: hypothetical protein KAI17_20895 [Thiotrichaceae bacterium]|nr:hypothetical protein [Thiotrichaceae bacterium]